uniref:Phosphoglycerate kinase n=1 Tax=Caldiarchaeum subterraneum TaxID=311458 RepID=A0A7C5U7X8_CALS0
MTETRDSTFIGGGDSVTANELMGFNPERFTFVSLGGGSLITYLSGGKMPGPEAPMKN